MIEKPINSVGMQDVIEHRVIHREYPASPAGGWVVRLELHDRVRGVVRIFDNAVLPAYAEKITVNLSFGEASS
jgi:hypothetical protein